MPNRGALHPIVVRIRKSRVIDKHRHPSDFHRTVDEPATPRDCRTAIAGRY
jgi:hypothetical protein